MRGRSIDGGDYGASPPSCGFGTWDPGICVGKGVGGKMWYADFGSRGWE